MSPNPRGSWSGFGRTGVLVVVGVAVAAYAAGLGLASVTISSGSEGGSGSAEGTSAVTWWHLVTTATDTIPLGLLLTSGNMTIPTALSMVNSSYAVGPATVGHGALRMDFQEKGAPGAKEFELTVTLVNATGVGTTATVFLETQFPAPGGPLSFSLFLDVGIQKATFHAATEVLQVCSTLGTCP